MKKTVFIAYLCFGVGVCTWFSIAAANGWRSPEFRMLDGSSYNSNYGGSGRSYGGSWGGGK